MPITSRCQSWAKRSPAMVVEEANTTASDQKKTRPDRVWRPGRLGAVAARAPVRTQVSPAAMWQARATSNNVPFVGDRQAEDLAGELGHGPHLHPDRSLL